jgi:hypothetical protein
LLTVSEVSVHGWLTPLLLGLSQAETLWQKGKCTAHGSPEVDGGRMEDVPLGNAHSGLLPSMRLHFLVSTTSQ